MCWMRKKQNNFQLRTLFWGPEQLYQNFMYFENRVDPDQLASGETWVEWKSDANQACNRKIFFLISQPKYMLWVLKKEPSQ